MVDNPKAWLHRYCLSLAIVCIVIIQCLLALRGPMAFVTKPTVLIAWPYSSRISEEESQRVFDHVQRSIARTRAFSVVPHDLIEDYFFEQQDDPDFAFSPEMSYRQYMDVATDLELDRLVVPSLYTGNDGINVTILFRRVPDGRILHRHRYVTTDVDAFIEGLALDGEDLPDRDEEDVPPFRFSLVTDMRVQTRSVGIFDTLFFLTLFGYAVLALLLAKKRTYDFLNQLLLVVGLLLFLFAFVYARNANMDYVQRFIADEGQINLAESTAKDHLQSAIRFFPLLFVSIYLYVRPRIGPQGSTNPRDISSTVAKWALPTALLSALLYALALPSFVSLQGLPIFGWVAVVPLFVVIIKSGFGRAFFYTVSFGALQTLIVNYWHGTYSYVSLAFTVILSSLLYAAMAPLFVWGAQRSGKWGFLFVSVYWVAFDLLRTQGYIGYPWGFIGSGQYALLPVIQVADLGGVYLVTFVVVVWNAAVAWWIAGPRFDRRAVCLVIGASVVGLTVAYGVIRLTVEGSTSAGAASRSMRIALTQQNTDPRKHDYQLSFDTLTDLTRAAMAESGGRGVDLVVWPEGGLKTDVRYWLNRNSGRENSSALAAQFLRFTSSIDTWLLTGTQDHTYLPDGEGGEQRRNYNSSLLMNDNGEIDQIYHKINLVPFTEHFPYKEQLPWIAELLDKFNTSNWLQGERRTIFSHPRGRFFTPICFEDIFPDHIRRFVKEGADLIVNISNDYWALTPVEGQQHAAPTTFSPMRSSLPGSSKSTISPAPFILFSTATSRSCSAFPSNRLCDAGAMYTICWTVSRGRGASSG